MKDWKMEYQKKFASKLSNTQFHEVGVWFEKALSSQLKEERARTEAYKAVAEKALRFLEKHKKSIDDLAEVEKLV